MAQLHIASNNTRPMVREDICILGEADNVVSDGTTGKGIIVLCVLTSLLQISIYLWQTLNVICGDGGYRIQGYTDTKKK